MKMNEDESEVDSGDDDFMDAAQKKRKRQVESSELKMNWGLEI